MSDKTISKVTWTQIAFVIGMPALAFLLAVRVTDIFMLGLLSVLYAVLMFLAVWKRKTLQNSDTGWLRVAPPVLIFSSFIFLVSFWFTLALSILA